MLNINSIYIANKYLIQAYSNVYYNQHKPSEWNDRLKAEMDRLFRLNKEIEEIMSGQSNKTLSVEFKTFESKLNENRN